jgi:Leucine-rich repeat (LRR) protein
MRGRTLAKMPGKYRRGTRSGYLKIWLWPLILVALSLVPGSFVGVHPDFQNLPIGLTSACRERDSLALVALYNVTDGPNWAPIKWNLDLLMNEWEGVVLNDEGCVIELSLHANNLVGSLPSAIGQMDQLEHLYLRFNKLTGPIPPEIGELVNLKNLTLGYNEISGPLPKELGQLDSLVYLDLGVNQITGNIPVEMGQLSNLRIFWLYQNQLSGIIPSQLGQLTKLEDLYFGNNRLTGTIPSSFKDLLNLESLSLGTNELTGQIPVELRQLNKLQSLALANNKLTGPIPPELGLLYNLRILVLHDNRLEGLIPEELGMLRNLQYLELNNNRLTGQIPAQIGQLGSLRRLELYNNQLSGPIPAQLGALDSCFNFQVFGNHLTGCFPNLTNFCTIDERLSGKFGNEYAFNSVDFSNNPGLPWQGDFSRLCAGEEQNGAPCDDNDPNTLNDIIRDCECRGDPLPCDRRSDSLEMVRFYQSLGGSEWIIPWNLQQPMDEWEGVVLSEDGCVVCIDLDGGPNLCIEDYSFIGNNLKGIMPDVSLPHLKTLVLNHNQITGNLPDFTGLVGLEEFYIAHNSISGSIPEFSGLQKLRIFDCQDNDIGGSIPNFMIPTLEVLDLHINQLSGPIPDFDNLPRLKVFSCYGNQLTGELPSFNSMANLEILNLALNRLSGSIPDYFNLRQLKFLDLAYNSLGGKIPDFNLPNLEVLFLNDCNLTGTILSFTNLPNLRALFCAHNNLTGMVPDFNEICPDLGLFHFQNNRLTFENIIETLESNQELVQSNDPNWYDYEMFDSLIYAPQVKIYRDTTFIVKEGDSLTIDLEIDEGLQSNRYRWSKDGAEYRIILGDNSLEIPSITLADIGTYIVEITNPNAPELTLESHPIRVVVEERMSCRERDSLALVALYQATDGPNWIIEWKLEEPMSTWRGVQLNEEGCVIGLNLGHEDGLVGSIPPEIGQLLNLKSLILRDLIHLTGPLPRELGQLESLEQLALFQNGLNGTIPEEIGNLTRLKELVLQGNQLTGSIPPSLSQLSELTYLDLRVNKLTGGIPQELGNLIQLEYLSLGNNLLSGTIPSQLLRLNELTFLSLNINQLTGTIIPGLNQLEKLKHLALSDNLLTGEIPVEISQLLMLEHLNLHGNQLTGVIPPELGNLSHLKELTIHANQLRGPIPQDLGKITELVVLNISSNQLTGIIPSELGSLRNLKYLDIYTNQLTGPIPPELGQLQNLYVLQIDNNQLSGNIPAEIGLLDSCILFRVGNNQLIGCFPGLENFCTIDERLSDHLGGHWGFNEVDFSNNPGLPWQGDFSRFCAGEEQNGAPCDDGDPNTLNDIIQDCECRGDPLPCDRRSDSLELVKFYHQTGGPDWDTTWKLDEPMDTWYGVVLSDDGCVTAIDMDGGTNLGIEERTFIGNNLTGQIPDISLPHLETLILNHNRLSGELPDFMGFPALINLHFAWNNISGSLPDFSNLPQLEVLFCEANNFSGGIPDFTRIPKLKHLFISGSPFGGTIPDFSNLPILETFRCWASELTGSIPDFSNLPNLYELQITVNNLTGHIPQFSNLPNLRVFTCSENQLDSLVPNLSDNCPYLSLYWVNDNQLTFEDIIDNLEVNTAHNSSNGGSFIYAPQKKIFRDTLITIREGQHLTIDLKIDEGLGSNVYRWFKDGNEYRVINGDNNLEFPSISLDDAGVYSAEVSNPNAPELTLESYPIRIIVQGTSLCRERDSLDLIALYNTTNGPNWTITWNPEKAISTWHGVSLNDEGCVVGLDLHDNNLLGSIAPELGQMENLKGLYLYNNRLSGPIPVELGQLIRCEELLLSGNQLSGNIPGALGQLVDLRSLWLNDNLLSGNIPMEFGLLSKLEGLALYSNQLTGEIPPELGQLNNLRLLLLQYNQLTGLIPPELGQLSNLEQLDLYGNQLSGSIPVELSQLSNLRLLHLMNNQLSGTIPPQLGNLVRLEGLGLHFNQLQGGIPQEFGNLINLRGLSMQGNQLTGNIPASLGNLSELGHLALYVNQLSGSIPPTLGNLRRLQSVYLNNNSLTGEIPWELGLLDSCYVFRADNNQLSGCFPVLTNFCTIKERLADHFGGLGDFNLVDFSNNPGLPWQGDFSRYCAGEDQTGAFCDDGDPNTQNTTIQDCSCREDLCPPGILEPTDIRIHTDCNDPAGNEITVQFGTSLRKVGWWSSTGGNGSTVSFDVSENSTHAYHLRNDRYWLFVESEDGCSDTLPPFDLREDGSARSIDLADDNFISEQGEIEIDVLANDRVSVSGLNISLLDANYPTKIQHLGNGIFRAAIPPSDQGILTATYQVCDNECRMVCDTAAIFIEFKGHCGDPGNYRLPNVITPFDGNGQNDELKLIYNVECPVFIEQISVINRWGDVVWKSTGPNEFWRGLNDRGEALPEGTYYYQVRLSIRGEGVPVMKTGHVTLLR